MNGSVNREWLSQIKRVLSIFNSKRKFGPFKLFLYPQFWPRLKNMKTLSLSLSIPGKISRINKKRRELVVQSLKIVNYCQNILDLSKKGIERLLLRTTTGAAYDRILASLSLGEMLRPSIVNYWPHLKSRRPRRRVAKCLLNLKQAKLTWCKFNALEFWNLP